MSGTDLFVAATEGKGPSGPPSGPPPDVLGDRDPVDAFEEGRQAVLAAYGKDGVLENPQMQMMAGIAFVDTLIHGWDLAKGTGQDTTMPPGLADAAMGAIGGRLTARAAAAGSSRRSRSRTTRPTQDKLIAYMGRQP